MKYKTYFCFIEKNGRLEYHIGKNIEELGAGNTLCRSIGLDSPHLKQFKKDCKQEAKTHGFVERKI